jgi:hypothetical protein
MNVETREFDKNVIVRDTEGNEIILIRKKIHIHNPTPRLLRRTKRMRRLLIESADGPAYLIDKNRFSIRRRVKAINGLNERVSEFIIADDRRTVPANIINEGTAAVAAYLFAVHGWSKPNTANMLDISPRTVNEYISAVSTGRR